MDVVHKWLFWIYLIKVIFTFYFITIVQIFYIYIHDITTCLFIDIDVCLYVLHTNGSTIYLLFYYFRLYITTKPISFRPLFGTTLVQVTGERTTSGWRNSEFPENHLIAYVLLWSLHYNGRTSRKYTELAHSLHLHLKQTSFPLFLFPFH